MTRYTIRVMIKRPRGRAKKVTANTSLYLYVEDVALFDHEGAPRLDLIHAINSFLRMPRNRGRILVVWSFAGYAAAKAAGQRAFEWTPHEHRDVAVGIPTDDDFVVIPDGSSWRGTGIFVLHASQFVRNVGAMRGGAEWDRIRGKPQSSLE